MKRSKIVSTPLNAEFGVWCFRIFFFNDEQEARKAINALNSIWWQKILQKI
jgi:hypothetical protein